MNKKKWFSATDPQAMLQYLKSRASDRKFRLFAVACCRRFEPLLAEDPVSRHAVDVAEQFADGRATVKECSLARAEVEVIWGSDTDPVLRAIRQAARATTKSKALGAALDTGHAALRLAGCAVGITRPAGPSAAARAASQLCAIRAERAQQIATIHRIFGNPFRPTAIDPGWLTADVLVLARGVYDEGAFDRMPILADALQDAGCTNEEVLHHLRHGTDHVRGCWVLDALSGKH